jgi:ClpP class serine protease
MIEELEEVARKPGMREIGIAYLALRDAEKKMNENERNFVKYLADAIEEFVNNIEKNVLKMRKNDKEQQK